MLVSKGIMDLLQGTLSVKSEGEGHGCTFTVTTLAKYILNTLNVDLPEYKAEDEEDERHAAMVGPVDAEYNNNDSHTNRTLRTSSVEISVSRFRSLRRTDSLRSVGSTSSKVVPLARCDSARSCTVGSISAQLSQEEEDDNPLETTSSIKILIVDDAKSNRKMLVRLLRSRCSVIGEALDGVDAVAQIKAMAEEGGGEGEGGQRPYDAILMDFVMPNMEGPEAAREIRELGFQGLIIGITGNVLPVDKERFISQGANIVLTKPVNLLDILTAFDSLLPTKKPRVSSFDI